MRLDSLLLSMLLAGALAGAGIAILASLGRYSVATLKHMRRVL